MRRSPGQITPLELVAARCAISVVLQVVADPEAAPGAPRLWSSACASLWQVISFIDNRPAMQMLLRGASREARPRARPVSRALREPGS